MSHINRRDALKMSGGFALAAAAGGFSCIEMAKAGPIDVPTPACKIKGAPTGSAFCVFGP
jgi:hypothetical protein